MNTNDKLKIAQGFIVVVIVASLAAGIFYGVKNAVFANFFSSGDIMKQVNISVEPQNKSKFLAFNKGFAETNRNGVKYYDFDGNILWNNSYSMQNQSVVKEASKFAVYDSMGKTLRVYNTEGLMYEVTVKDPISNVSVNENGYAAVVQCGQLDRRVQVYNDAGNIVLERIDEDSNIFPIQADVSSDNTLVAIGYIDTSGMELLSTVLVVKIADVNMTQIDSRIFATQTFEQELLCIVKFVGAANVFAATDKRATYLHLGESVVGKSDLVQWTIEFKNEIHQICFNENTSFAISYASQFPGVLENEFGDVLFYDMNGKLIHTFSNGSLTTYMHASNGITVLGFDKNFYGFNDRGSEIFRFASIEDVTELVPLNHKDLAIKVSKNEAVLTDLTKKTSPSDEEPDFMEQDSSEQDSSEQNVDMMTQTENTETEPPDENDCD